MKLGARMPRCVGTFSPSDTECNGDKKSMSEVERAPCVYRDRCVALQEISIKEKRSLDHYITLRVIGRDYFAFSLDEELLPKVQKVISDFRINGGMAAARRRNRPLAIVAPKPTKEEAAVTALEMADWIFARLATRLVSGTLSIRRKMLAVSDRSKKSGYKSLYLRRKKGPMALMSVYAKPSRNLAEVRLAENFDRFVSALPASEFNLLAPVDITGKDGSFKVKILNVDVRRAGIIVDRFSTLLLSRL